MKIQKSLLALLVLGAGILASCGTATDTTTDDALLNGILDGGATENATGGSIIGDDTPHSDGPAEIPADLKANE